MVKNPTHRFFPPTSPNGNGNGVGHLRKSNVPWVPPKGSMPWVKDKNQTKDVLFNDHVCFLLLIYLFVLCCFFVVVVSLLLLFVVVVVVVAAFSFWKSTDRTTIKEMPNRRYLRLNVSKLSTLPSSKAEASSPGKPRWEAVKAAARKCTPSIQPLAFSCKNSDHEIGNSKEPATWKATNIQKPTRLHMWYRLSPQW